MKKLLAFSVLAIIVLCSCQKETLKTEKTSELKIFTAEIEDNNDSAATRTVLDANGNVLWEAYDGVYVFAGNTGYVPYYVSEDSDLKTTATLIPADGYESATGDEISCNIAYYPFQNVNLSITGSNEDYVISNLSLSRYQIYAEGSFGSGDFPMVAVSGSTEDTNFKFKNILGGLKLQLKGSTSLRQISVSGNAGEILCGECEVTASATALPTVKMVDSDSTDRYKTVTLSTQIPYSSDDVQLNDSTATSFIIALPPMTFESGFTVTVTDSDGKQMEIKTTRSQTIHRSKLLKMPVVRFNGTSEEVDYLEEPFTITSVGNTSVSLTKVGNPNEVELQYRKNGGEWSAYTISDAIDLAYGETVQFKSENENTAGGSFSKSEEDYYNVKVSGSGYVKASGNCGSLTYSNSYGQYGTTVPMHGFAGLFNGCDRLQDASNLKLPSSIAYIGCYQSMFSGCSNLTAAPALPATTLEDDCYRSMFSGCTSLTTAPELPATDLDCRCYQSMFEGCTGLTVAPVLPATEMEDGYDTRCYAGMFAGCIGLTTAPALPAMTLAGNCYESMFSGCTGLTSAPELPATELASWCYFLMFEGCIGLTAAPELPATTLVGGCYDSMFVGCSGIKYIKALFTTEPSNDYTYDWVSGVASDGTFVKSKDATWDVRGVNGIPEGWTVTTE